MEKRQRVLVEYGVPVNRSRGLLMVRYLEYVRLERSNNSAGCSINPFVVDRRFDGYEEIVAMVKNER